MEPHERKKLKKLKAVSDSEEDEEDDEDRIREELDVSKSFNYPQFDISQLFNIQNKFQFNYRI